MAGIRQAYKQVPYKPGLPSLGAACLTMNVQTLIDIVVLHGEQMPL